LVTPAAVSIVNENTIELLQHQKKMLVQLHYKGKAVPFSKSASPSTHYENENKGIQIVGFDFQLQPNEKTTWEISVEAKK
jgi:hypothetical protein